MKQIVRFIYNFTWLILAIPFYILILLNCIYTNIMLMIDWGKYKPYKWVALLDRWMAYVRRTWIGYGTRE